MAGEEQHNYVPIVHVEPSSSSSRSKGSTEDESVHAAPVPWSATSKKSAAFLIPLCVDVFLILGAIAFLSETACYENQHAITTE